MLVISEGAQSQLLPILISFSPPIFLDQVFCSSIARACHFPLGFICIIFSLCFLIQSARPLKPGQIFRGAVADLLSRAPVRRPGFSQPDMVFFLLMILVFGSLTVCAVVACALVFLSVVRLCLARWENLLRQLFYSAIVSCCLATRSPAW
jgi:hypothetical protein